MKMEHTHTSEEYEACGECKAKAMAAQSRKSAREVLLDRQELERTREDDIRRDERDRLLRELAEEAKSNHEKAVKAGVGHWSVWSSCEHWIRTKAEELK